MTDTSTAALPMSSPADIDCNKLETRVANANAQMERMKVEFRDSPAQRLERARAELQRMSDDINFQNALASDNQGAKNQLTSVRHGSR